MAKNQSLFTNKALQSEIADFVGVYGEAALWEARMTRLSWPTIQDCISAELMCGMFSYILTAKNTGACTALIELFEPLRFRQIVQRRCPKLVNWPCSAVDFARLYKGGQKCLSDHHIVRNGQKGYTYNNQNKTGQSWKGAQYGKYFFEEHLQKVSERI